MTGIAIGRQQLGRTLSGVMVALVLVGVGLLGGLGLARLAPHTEALALRAATVIASNALSAEQAYRTQWAGERDFALPVSAEQAYRTQWASDRDFALPVSAEQAYRTQWASERDNLAP
jgi:Tfp pilus assembly protein PilV